MGRGKFMGLMMPDVDPDLWRSGEISLEETFNPIMKFRDQLKP